MYGFNTSIISSRFVSVCIAKSIGLDKSKLKIPMMDFASITYLPEIKSKSKEKEAVDVCKAWDDQFEYGKKEINH